MGAAVPFEDRGEQRLDGGLAVGPGDADHARAAALAHATGDLAQRQQRVADDHLRHRDRQGLFDQECLHPRRHRGGGESVAVVVLAAQRDE